MSWHCPLTQTISLIFVEQCNAQRMFNNLQQPTINLRTAQRAIVVCAWNCISHLCLSASFSKTHCWSLTAAQQL